MLPMIDATNAIESTDAAKITSLLRIGGPLSSAEKMALVQGVETVRSDGKRMLSGIGWSMTVLPKLHGTVDPVRLDGFMTSARLHYGACARPLPPNWPSTLLTPWTNGAPGLAVAHSVTPVSTSGEAQSVAAHANLR